MITSASSDLQRYCGFESAFRPVRSPHTSGGYTAAVSDGAYSRVGRWRRCVRSKMLAVFAFDRPTRCRSRPRNIYSVDSDRIALRHKPIPPQPDRQRTPPTPYTVSSCPTVMLPECAEIFRRWRRCSVVRTNVIRKHWHAILARSAPTAVEDRASVGYTDSKEL